MPARHRTDRRAARRRAAPVVGALLLFGGCTLEQRRGDHTVTIDDRHFAPTELRVRRGERVAWHNRSAFVHAVAADLSRGALPTGALPLRSGDLPPGRIWTYVPTVVGRYAYHCPHHREAGMIAMLVVVDE